MSQEKIENQIMTFMNMITKNVSSSISIFRIEKGKEELLYANDFFYQLMGVDREHYNRDVHLFNTSLVSESDHKKIAEIIRKAALEEKPGEMEHRFRRPDGTLLWLRRRYDAIKQETPDTYILLCVVHDITEKKKAELQQILEHQRYQVVIDELKAAVFEWNISQNYFYSSEGFYHYELSKAEPEDILYNRASLDYVHPDDRELLEQFLHRENKDDRPEIVLRLKMTDGSYRFSHLIGLKYRDEGGKVERVIGIIIDINEEREKSFMLDSLLNEIPGGVAVFKVAENMECQYFNEGFRQISGRSKEDLEMLNSYGTLVNQLVVPSDFTRFSTTVRKLAKQGKPINLNFRCVLADESIEWLHVAAGKMREEDGYPVYYCIFTVPSEESKLYRSIVEESDIGVFVAERTNRRILYMNDAVRDIYNLSKNAGRDHVKLTDVVRKEYLLLSREQLDSLTEDQYSSFHVLRENKQYLGIKAKAMMWNGVDSYILYITDDTIQHKLNEKLQNLIDHIPGGIGIFEIYDGNTHQIYMNDSFYHLLKDCRENRTSGDDTDFFRFIHTDDIPNVQHMIRTITEGADETGCDYRVRNGQGQYIWLRLTAQVVVRTPNKIKINCCFTDISESMKARKELEKSNVTIKQQYEQECARRELLEKNSIASICANATKQKVTVLQRKDNALLEIVSDMSFTEGLSKLLPRVKEADDQKLLLQYMDLNGVKHCIRSGMTEKSIEYQSYQEDGHLRWMRIVLNYVEELKNGDLMAYAYFYDIDDEKKAVLAGESVIDEEIDYVMLVKVESGLSRFVRLKNSFKDAFEHGMFALSDMKKSHEREMTEKEDLPQLDTFFQLDYLIEQLEAVPVVTAMYRFKNMDGTEQRKKLRAFYLDDTHDDLIIARRDITDLYNEEQHQKKVLQDIAAEAVRANQAKTEFLSRMSHDMRTPMNGILGLAEISKDISDVDVLKENIAKIQESGGYLLGLINDTLDFQRIESRKLDLDVKVVSAKELYDTIIDIIKPEAENKQLHFGVHNINADLDCFIRVDPVRFRQILINLLSNAVKYTRAGGEVILELECLKRDDKIAHERICIRDTGIGMSRDFIENKIFQPFSQENNEFSAKYVGSGLGLSIVKSLTEMMGGRIEVESELEKGSSFTIFFKFERVTKADAVEERNKVNAKQFKTRSSLNGINILLAEDNELNAKIAQALLQKAGCTVTWRENGKEAVETFKRSKQYEYDVILMDIRMPVMDGLTATAEIRKLNRVDALTVPIIAMTADAYDEDVNRSLNAGLNSHLSKPVVPALLYETIAKYTCKTIKE